MQLRLTHQPLLLALALVIPGQNELAGADPALAPLPKSVTAPAGNPTTAAKVELGKLLFFDPRLSGDNKMSCATCHVPDKAFGDGLPRGKGANNKTLSRNSQTVLNVGFYSTFFWDGRAKSLEEQALGPIESPDEMNQNINELVGELTAIPAYTGRFQKVFGEEIKAENIAKALAAFQRTLVTRNSPLDRYLAGDEDALSALAKQGLELFRGEADCIRCHHGPLLSDGKFYRLGVGLQDNGRGAITGKRDDLYKFRTPSLRDVARTGPYMHDGSLKTLFDVVQFYYRDAASRGPEGLKLDVEPLLGQSFSEIDAIVEFLRSLDGELPKVVAPKLP
ncbi:MAG: cytochrome-c peroxidase [Planctomycetaceae bacterium]|nr:cytochrome-c peroxidase [Planctomycetaceae bacterium]